jgi:hypothetical protein
MGMTMRWLEADYNEEKARFSAVLPARLIAGHILAARRA